MIFSLTLLVVVRHAVFELNGEVAEGAWPVGDRVAPFGTDVFEAQIKQLEERDVLQAAVLELSFSLDHMPSTSFLPSRLMARAR